MELVPIGTILALVINQVVKTANAAKDVVFEKESFKVLSKHLFDIEPVLNELQLHKLNDSAAARKALEFLEADVKKANNLVDKYKHKSRFYLLVKCRHIVKEVQDVTRDIGKSLAALSLASTEVLTGISDQVNRLQNEMQRAEFEASQSRLQIVDKLNQALSDQKLDQGFANDMLQEIAMAVGIPVDPLQISKELESFRREKEEAADRKERAEVLFLEQVIELLSQADAARDYNEVRNQYFERLQVIERYDPREEYIEPFRAFICCINGTVMNDPVSLCTGTACERAALEEWFDSGKRTDPQTGDLLEDCSYRSNLQLRQSIQEWKELNYCVKIRSCQAKLLSDVDTSMGEALVQMQELMRENSITKDWISIGGLTELLICILRGSHNEDLQIMILATLKDIVEGHVRNKDLFITNQGFNHVISCLGCDSRISQVALQLLYELLRDRTDWNESYCMVLSQQPKAMAFLIELLKSPVEELVKKAEEILMKLCDVDEENIIKAAKEDWYRPLVDRINQGPASSRLLMVRELVTLQLVEQSMKLLGDEGVIPTLLEMTHGNIESKELSLSALAKLLGCHDNKRLMAAAGGVPLVLKLMYSSHTRTIITVKCCEILERLSSDGDGVKFLVDENGTQLELGPIITHLMAFQQNLSSFHVRKPALRALLEICLSEAQHVKTAVLSAGGVSLVLALLDDSDFEIRKVAINLLFLFSQHEPQGVAEYLQKPRRLEALVGFLENNENGDVQMAAAGLLANLPKSELSLTQKLIELGGLRAIIDIIRSGTMEARENALSALFRFTDPTNIKSQKIVVELGAYSLLVNFLNDGSVTVKARAAALIGELSMRSPELTAVSKKAGCWCLFLKHVPVCPAHGGICSVNTSFCLLEAKALPGLVKLLQEEVHETAYEAIQTLSTLVQEESPYKGAKVLHEASAIGSILAVLTWGSESLKEEALGLLEKIFKSKDIVDLYGMTAREPLASLTGRCINEDGRLQRKAARVLILIERYSRSSTSLVQGLPG